jgi:hypothetical protein
MLTLSIRHELFWDIDLSRFDQEKNARLVVERVFRYGNIQELKTILNYYGRKKISELITEAGYLDRKTLSFASLLLNIPKEDFRCYRKKLSPDTHWS